MRVLLLRAVRDTNPPASIHQDGRGSTIAHRGSQQTSVESNAA
jgi:hypothetical protein